MIRPQSWCAVAVLALAALVSCARRPSVVTAITVVADPGPLGTVEEAANAEARVVWTDQDPRDDDACTASFAAAELRDYLPRGLRLPSTAIHLAPALPDSGDVIVIGVSRSSPLVTSLLGDADLASAAPGGFRLRALERDGRRILVAAGDDRAGALYGAYALLERLGVTFYGLGDTGTVVSRARAEWPRRLEVLERPAFGARGFWAWEARGHRDFFLWMARNRMNQWTAVDSAWVPLMKKLGFALTGGGHTIQSEFLSPERYFGAHPEWYGLHDRRRSRVIRGESGDNFCTSNAEARRILTGNLVDALVNGSLRNVDVLNLWMLDGGRWCECEVCRAAGSPTDRLLDLASEVDVAVDSARAQGRLHRPVEIATLAYLETLAPPSREHRLGHPTVNFFPYFRCYAHALFDSTCTEINRRIAGAHRGWDAARLRWGMCEYYNVAAFRTLPLVFPHVMASDLARYRNATAGPTRLGYMHAPTRLWGCWTLNHWLLARLAWDTRSSPDTLVARFCADYFPAAADAMREHYRQLEIASANILALQHCAGVYGTNIGPIGRLAYPAAPLFPLKHLQDVESHPPTNDAPDLDQIEGAMAAARAALDRARRVAGAGADERSRLAEEERRLAYGEHMFALYLGLIRTTQQHRAGNVAGARSAFSAAERAAEALLGITDLVQVSSSHANARDGLEASGVRGTYEFFAERYRARY